MFILIMILVAIALRIISIQGQVIGAALVKGDKKVLNKGNTALGKTLKVMGTVLKFFSRFFSGLALSSFIVLLLVAVILIMTLVLPAAGLLTLFQDSMVENGTDFDTAVEDVLGVSESSSPAVPTDSKVTWIGDSYSVQATDLIKKEFPDVNLECQVSKHFAQDSPDGSGGDSGLTILKSMLEDNKVSNILVFALGTNDPISSKDTALSYIDDLISLAGSSRRVILVTPYTKNYALGTYDYSKILEAMRESTSKYNNIELVDWESLVKGNEDKYFAGDGIHPNNEGIELWFNAIKKQVNNE